LISLRERLKAGGTLIVAHAGASAGAPENTMAAFHLALEQGADSIELDVHLSSDLVPVVIHDHALDRTTDGTGLVGEHSLAELKRLDAGRWFGDSFAGERIPSLEEVLRWARGRVPLHIEIKNNPIRYPDIAPRIVGTVEQLDMVEEVEVFSFDHTVVRDVKRMCPGLATGVCYAADPVDHLVLARMAEADALHPHWSTLRPEVVADAHQEGLFVAVWTVNDPQVARRMAQWNVDGIATDAPDKMRSALGQ